ncbi:MAG: XdhC family protein [Pseudomonadaceae bacterium]|nr:XdhC family protein [Pseudomonadaceae bacterium]
MQAVDKEVLTQLLAWLNDQQKCWLATVVQTWGSSPRPVGSLFACNENGQMVGSLSGGCVEDDLLTKLANAELAAAGPQFFEYGVSTEEAEKFGLPCGGALHIVVEPQHIDPQARSNLIILTEALDARRCVSREVDLKHGRTSVRAVAKHSPLAFDPTTQVLKHTYGPRLQLFIIGAGMVSQYLAEMALMLGYEVTVCDPRQAMMDDFKIAGVRKIVDMPDDAIKTCANDELSAIVALTHDPRIDDMGLMEALTTSAFYIGAMGSTRTSASRRERLLELDVSLENIDKLHAPIGLPIGSKTPPEIAIAILAEINAIRTQRLPEVMQQLNAASAG